MGRKRHGSFRSTPSPGYISPIQELDGDDRNKPESAADDELHEDPRGPHEGGPKKADFIAEVMARSGAQRIMKFIKDKKWRPCRSTSWSAT